jgi:hypothetical protein
MRVPDRSRPPRIAAATPVGTGFAGTSGMRARLDRLLLGLVCASLTSVGCSSTNGVANPDGASSDGVLCQGEPDGDASSVDCRGELGDVGQNCPTMFDGAPENVPPCARLGVQQVWTCEDVIALSLGAGAFSVDCYYGSSSHLLVGAMAVNDTNTLCGNSFTETAGEIPTVACRFPVVMPSFYRSCGAADSGSN